MDGDIRVSHLSHYAGHRWPHCSLTYSFSFSFPSLLVWVSWTSMFIKCDGVPIGPYKFNKSNRPHPLSSLAPPKIKTLPKRQLLLLFSTICIVRKIHRQYKNWLYTMNTMIGYYMELSFPESRIPQLTRGWVLRLEIANLSPLDEPTITRGTVDGQGRLIRVWPCERE